MRKESVLQLFLKEEGSLSVYAQGISVVVIPTRNEVEHSTLQKFSCFYQWKNYIGKLSPR